VSILCSYPEPPLVYPEPPLVYPGAAPVHAGGRANLSCAEPGAVLNRVLRGGLSALGCLVAAAVVVVAIPAPHAAEPVTISYRADLSALARLAPYPAVAPASLPASWQPVSSGLTAGGASGAGTVTWLLGYMTPDGALVSLAESNADAGAFVRRMTNNGAPLPAARPGPARLDGQAWNISATPARGQRSMYVTSPAGFTVVLTGNASWAELRVLAASLRPVTAGV
jgi:hypothetical protein